MSGPTYQPPLSPQIAQWLAELDDDANEFFQERAAVREHMGDFSREQAENLAWAETQRYVERRDARRR
ncbi:MAG: hypothetical protein L6Q69_14550 [Zoogloea sp.]|nr:hypothetical protein [Zoogloea sp.]